MLLYLFINREGYILKVEVVVDVFNIVVVVDVVVVVVDLMLFFMLLYLLVSREGYILKVEVCQPTKYTAQPRTNFETQH